MIMSMIAAAAAAREASCADERGELRCKNCVTRNVAEGSLFCVVCDISQKGHAAEMCAWNLHHEGIPAGECRGAHENCKNNYCPRIARRSDK